MKVNQTDEKTKENILSDVHAAFAGPVREVAVAAAMLALYHGNPLCGLQALDKEVIADIFDSHGVELPT